MKDYLLSKLRGLQRIPKHAHGNANAASFRSTHWVGEVLVRETGAVGLSVNCRCEGFLEDWLLDEGHLVAGNSLLNNLVLLSDGVGEFRVESGLLFLDSNASLFFKVGKDIRRLRL